MYDLSPSHDFSSTTETVTAISEAGEKFLGKGVASVTVQKSKIDGFAQAAWVDHEITVQGFNYMWKPGTTKTSQGTCS